MKKRLVYITTFAVYFVALSCLFTPLFASKSESPVISKEGYPILDGQALTLIDIHNLKNNPEELVKSMQAELQRAAQEEVTFDTPKKIAALEQNISRLQQLITYVHPYLFWWQELPTVGLRLKKPFWPVRYPYFPHAFALWQLAPTMGHKIDVFLIDTGFAAFALEWNHFYKKHQDLQMLVDFSQEKYNFADHSHDVLDPFEQLIEIVMDYTDDNAATYDADATEQYLRKQMPLWIKQYLQEGVSTDISHYLCTRGKKHLSEKQQGKKVLTQEGKRALREILQGELGFRTKHAVKKGQKNNYTLVNLHAPNYQKNIIMEFLPVAPILQANLARMNDSEKEDMFFAAAYETGHGSHSAGIIGALLHSYQELVSNLTPSTITAWLQKDSGICGIAPRAHTVMIKALRSDGEISDRTTVIKGVKQAYKLGAKVLNLSLKIDDQLDTTAPDIIELQSTLEKIPYVVASSGNATKKELGVYQTGIEGYPAKFSSIPFDVGAFGFYKDKDGKYHCPIIDISQYQEGVGPKCVMPGHNILSCGLIPNQQEDSMYVFMQGTSAAAPMVSGLLGLVLGEFEGEFGKDERSLILKVCYSSTIRMHDNDDWKNKTLLGTIDMRTVLFVLHVLRSLKKTIEKTSYLKKEFSFKKMSDFYIQAIHAILQQQITDFTQEQGIEASFKYNFMGFFNEVHTKVVTPLPYMKKKIFTSLTDALYFVERIILAVIDPEHTTAPRGYSSKNFAQIKKIFKQSSVNLFSEYTHATQTRISLAL